MIVNDFININMDSKEGIDYLVFYSNYKDIEYGIFKADNERSALNKAYLKVLCSRHGVEDVNELTHVAECCGDTLEEFIKDNSHLIDFMSVHELSTIERNRFL